MEKDVLHAIATSEYRDTGDLTETIWSFSIANNTRVARPGQIPGVVASLAKKGLVISSQYDKPSERTVQLTRKGIELYKKIYRVTEK